MRKRNVVWSIAVVGLLAAVWFGQAFSQEGDKPRGRGPRTAKGQRQWNPEQVRQRMLTRIKQALSASDKDTTPEEWKVLEPKVEKVLTLSGQTRGMRGMASMFGRRTRGGQRPGGAEPTRELTDVEKLTQALQTVLANKEAKLEEIKEKLTALRQAREKAEQELVNAQKALREALTLRQEAQLVLMGLLD